MPKTKNVIRAHDFIQQAINKRERKLSLNKQTDVCSTSDIIFLSSFSQNIYSGEISYTHTHTHIIRAHLASFSAINEERERKRGSVLKRRKLIYNYYATLRDGEGEKEYEYVEIRFFVRGIIHVVGKDTHTKEFHQK